VDIYHGDRKNHKESKWLGGGCSHSKEKTRKRTKDVIRFRTPNNVKKRKCQRGQGGDPMPKSP